MKPRRGDSVLIRALVESGDGNSSIVQVRLQPYSTGVGRFAARPGDIYKVEPVFLVGDRVTWGSPEDQESGVIVALSPEDVNPPQAWVRDTRHWALSSLQLSSLTRIDE